MNENEVKHLAELIRAKKDRLHQLELKEAKYGLDVPPQIPIEIEELRDEIAGLQAQLAALEEKREPGRLKEKARPVPAPPQRQVNWERVGAIAGVIGLLIALGTWLVPDVRDVLVSWLFEMPTVTPISSPTHTPVISTATPTNTPSPPTATATSTPACSMAPMHGFDSIWENTSVIRERLGCPLEAARKTLPVEESFQNGRMFWCKDADRIYVIYADGTWQEYENPWRERDPQTSC